MTPVKIENELKQPAKVAELIMEKFMCNDDIRVEFENRIEHRIYPQVEPISVERYMAEDISNLAPFMEGVGTYTFLITLREHLENGKRYIAMGFSRR